MNKKFSIVIHPVNRELLYDYEPSLRKKSIGIAKKVLEWMSPFKVSDIQGIKSQYTGREIEGELIMCPLLMEQMISLNPRKVFYKVKKAAKFAESRGTSLLGLAAYTALVGDRGLKIRDALSLPVTTGNHLSLAVVSEAILRAVRVLEYTLENMNVLICGANYISFSTILGLGNSVRRIYIHSPHKEKLKIMMSNLSPNIRKKIEVVGLNFRNYLKGINLVVVATNQIPLDLKVEYLRKGTIIFDASYPRKMTTSRPDILIIDGVSMQPPGDARFHFNFGLPEGLCFPCMAEPITLFLEDRYESYSIGKEISLEKAQDIFRLSLRHGFKMGPLTCSDSIIDDKRIEELKENIYATERKFFILDKWRRGRR